MSATISNNNQEEKKKTTSSRGWMVTINNPKIPGDAYLAQWLADGLIVFGCGQLERAPETGTPHHQMYVVTIPNPSNKNGYGIKWMKQKLHNTAHFDNRRGTHEQARDYCTLPEYEGKKKIVITGPWTVGEWSGAHELTAAERKKGSTKGGEKVKANWNTMLADIKAGKSDLDLMMQYPHLFLSSHKAVEKARLIFSTAKTRRQPDVIVYYGPTGSGKSHKANSIMIANGGGKAFRKGNGGNFWADGYDEVRHPVVWFDEFDGSWFSYKQLLRITDKWTLDLDTKGGVVNFNPKIIIFTSSKHPKEWYSIEAVPDTTELMRRLSGKHGAIINLHTKYVEPVEDGPDLIDRMGEIEVPIEKPIEKTAVLSNSIPVGVDVERPPTWEEHLAANSAVPRLNLKAYESIDDDDDIDDKAHPTPPGDDDDNGFGEPETASQEQFFDLLNCEICGNNVRDGCDCFDFDASQSYTDEVEGDGYISDDFPALRDAQHVSVADAREAMLLARHNAMTAQSTSDLTPKTSAPTAPSAPRKRAAELFFEPPPKAPASEFKKYKQVPGQSRLAMAPSHTQHRDDDDE